MTIRKNLCRMLAAVPILAVFCLSAFPVLAAPLVTSAPSSPVKLVFIHHSCGQNWLTDDNGDLGLTLRDNNYFVSDTNYGWGPDSIGDLTDIGQWWRWFRGPSSATYTAALYALSDANSTYSRLASDPGGENVIVMFKSCYPNSEIGGLPTDPATTGDNPLAGENCDSENHTVANAKGIYNDLLTYFAAHRDKLFVAVTAPPVISGSRGANARAFNDWLVNDWLADYPYANVQVFDFYNVLTSNGGDAYTNDLGETAGNHHRVASGAVEHPQTVAANYGAYCVGGDSHPTSAGNRKATGEFVTLLNAYYHCFHGDGGCPRSVAPQSSPALPALPALLLN